MVAVDSFQGEIFHSSQWRHDISLQGKNVVVVGNGCSATQFVPKIAVESESVTQFIRSQQVHPFEALLIEVRSRT